MVQKSYGKMRGTRSKLKMRKKLPINNFVREFKPGDTVHIEIYPASKFQSVRFQGKTGTVVERKGRSYVIKVTDGNMPKTVYLRPEHLHPVRQS